MTPHPRKDNPPRREPGSGDDSSTTPAEGESSVSWEQGDAVVGNQNDIIYDPGAALVDENRQYGDQEYGYVDPGEAYADPNAGYEQQEYGYVDPGEAYADPNAGYEQQEYGHVDPGEAYADPNAGYEQQEYRQVDSGQGGFQPPPPVFSAGGVYDESPQSAHEVPAVPSSRAKKKKVTHRAPQRRPAVPGRKAPGTRYSPPRPSYSSGGGFSLMTVFLTLIALGMLALVVMVVMPRDMTAVAGYPVNPLATGKPRNLLDESQKIMIQRTSEIAFTEAEVNQYLNHRLQAEQTGLMASLVKFRGVYVDFSPGFAEIVIERELFGKPLTMSAKVRPEKFRQKTEYRAVGWTLGSIDLGSRNIKPVIELFLRLRDTCFDEYQTIQQMVDVRFEENKLVLDSRI